MKVNCRIFRNRNNELKIGLLCERNFEPEELGNIADKSILINEFMRCNKGISKMFNAWLDVFIGQDEAENFKF